ncbi:GDSL-type esterase/lipase family protein [Desertivirga xinjiangensis]|uniref:GDSL-type esterase/lipase family protein n=1 Tax=Desertivirga xinjiangensis TaxID=539206 RepID=UPI00210BCE8A|nr:GDSL-type esterase/lipase family protein [Pedobacter xinjiangensis]
MVSSHSAVCQQAASVDSSYANGYYKQRLSFFKQIPDRKNEIVFLGNSITEAGEWQELIHRKNVLNRGISGDNSFGVFYRLDEILASKPKKIFLMIGVNDLKRGTPPAVIVNNYERIARKIQKDSPKTRLYFQSVLPVAETILSSSYSKLTNEKIRELNTQLRSLALRYGLPFIDLHTDVFADLNNSAQMKINLTTDGIHLQPVAYILWAQYLKTNNYL